jgi:AmmeMemoRadiSam system protein B
MFYRARQALGGNERCWTGRSSPKLGFPKALITHAGYIYSGPRGARLRRTATARGSSRGAVGPCIAQGLAAPDADYFATPLGHRWTAKRCGAADLRRW